MTAFDPKRTLPRSGHRVQIVCRRARGSGHVTIERRHFLTAGMSLVATPFLFNGVDAQATRSSSFKYGVDADSWLQPYVKANAFIGAVLVAKDGKAIFQRAYGWADRELNVPNTLNTKFRIGSMTKAFTAASIMQLAEQGKLGFNDPISKYYTDAPASWSKVTLLHLLTHTSGIPSVSDLPNFSSVRLTTQTPEDLIKQTRDMPLQFEPGSQFYYDNTGYIILGYVIEKVSGQSYASYLQERIFSPLGMHNSGYDVQSSIIQDRASGYQRQDGQWINAPYMDMTVPYAAGAIYSTAGDLLIWDQAWYGNKLLNTSSIKQALTDYGHQYGFGWIIDQAFGRKRDWFSGGVLGFHSWISRYVDDRLTIIMLSNYQDALLDRMERELAGLYILSGEKPRERKLPLAVLKAYEGRYRTENGQMFTIARQGDGLTFQAGNPPHRMFFKSADNFSLYPLDVQLTFRRDGAGKITGLLVRNFGTDLPSVRVG